MIYYIFTVKGNQCTICLYCHHFVTTENMKDLTVEQVLAQFGLSNPEIRVYLASLSLGSQPVSVIAKKSQLKRGHTYNMLHLLAERGLVQEHTKNKVKYFSVGSPRDLLTLVKRREDELKHQKLSLENVVPLLLQLQNPLISQPQVRFFQGVEGIKEIYDDTIKKGNSVIYAFCDYAYVFPQDENIEHYDWIWRYVERRARKNVLFKGIVNKSDVSDIAYKKRKQHNREMKMLTNIELAVEINVYENKVAIMSTSGDMIGVIIEDEKIAQTLKNLHSAFWELLPNYR